MPAQFCLLVDTPITVSVVISTISHSFSSPRQVNQLSYRSRAPTYELYLSGWWFETLILFFHILGISSSHLTNSYFSEGLKPPTNYYSCLRYLPLHPRGHAPPAGHYAQHPKGTHWKASKEPAPAWGDRSWAKQQEMGSWGYPWGDIYIYIHNYNIIIYPK